MPSLIPTYVYTLFAALIVGSIIVVGCSTETIGVKNQALSQQLTNIDQYVATKSLALINQAVASGQNTTESLNLPSEAANQVYWVWLVNAGLGAEVKSGIGAVAVCNDQNGVAIPAQVSSSGVYVSNSGRAYLQCLVENQTVVLTLMGV
jgi:hypothetical protein